MRHYIITGNGKRFENEDVVVNEKLSSISDLFLIADGIGGLKEGKVAAQIVSTSIITYLKNKDN